MNTITTKPNETVSDLILMAYGTMECGMQFLQANNTSITATLAVGDSYNLPDGLVGDNDVLQYLQQNEVVIGTKG